MGLVSVLDKVSKVPLSADSQLHRPAGLEEFKLPIPLVCPLGDQANAIGSQFSLCAQSETDIA